MQIKNPDIIHRLEKIGLNNKEALVYTSLLELGGAFPSRIAEYSGLKRSTVYNVLVTLSVRGMVNEIEKRNKLYYQIEKPEKILRYASNQIATAEDNLEKAKGLIPDIQNIYGLLKNQPKITYYEGSEGILSIYEQHISVKKPYEMVAWANASALRNLLPSAFFDKYVKTKEEIGIVTRGILPDTPENRAFNSVRYANIMEKNIPVLRYVPEKYFPSSHLGEITIYGTNKVSIVNFDSTKMIGTVIEDESIHKIMRMIFELSWQSKLLRE